MALFVWNKTLSVDVAVFDAHHRNLLNMINDLHDAMLNKKGSAAMEGIVERLVDYTKYHFTEEEKLMKALDFHGYEAHRAEHEAFVAKTEDLRNKLKKGETNISAETMRFLLRWFKSHIRGTDREYSLFFQARMVPPKPENPDFPH